jgi:hypothetical protein
VVLDIQLWRLSGFYRDLGGIGLGTSYDPDSSDGISALSIGGGSLDGASTQNAGEVEVQNVSSEGYTFDFAIIFTDAAGQSQRLDLTIVPRVKRGRATSMLCKPGSDRLAKVRPQSSRVVWPCMAETLYQEDNTQTSRKRRKHVSKSQLSGRKAVLTKPPLLLLAGGPLHAEVQGVLERHHSQGAVPD